MHQRLSEYAQIEQTAQLPPVRLLSGDGERHWDIELRTGCVNPDDASEHWDPGDVQFIEIPAGGMLSLYSLRDCRSTGAWAGSGRTDIAILGLAGQLHSLMFVRWTEEDAGSIPFKLTSSGGTELNIPARNDAINFGNGGNVEFPENSLVTVEIPEGYAAHVFDLSGCRFTGRQINLSSGNHDLRDHDFADKVSSMWLIRI